MDDELTDDLDGAVWLRRAAVADGYSDRQIRAKLRSGEWHRVRRGAYCSGVLWDGLSETDRYRLLCRAVLLAAHPDTVLSHVSAAVEHGAPVWGIPLTEVHTTRTDRRSGRREAGIVHHRGALPEDQVTVVNGLPVTSPARSVIEVCGLMGVEQALVTANGMLNAGLTTLEELVALSHDTRYWPDSLNTRLVLDLAHPKIESAAESRAWYLCWAEHVPRPEPQVEIFDERHRLVARVDFAWQEHGVFLEVDGRAKYVRHRREGETLEEFIMREKRREELICLLTGWVCVRVTWEDLASPRRVARRVLAVLDSRRDAS